MGPWAPIKFHLDYSKFHLDTANYTTFTTKLFYNIFYWIWAWAHIKLHFDYSKLLLDRIFEILYIIIL